MPVDYSKYHPDWKDVIRPQALARANYKCQNCRIRQKSKGYRTARGLFVECDEFMEEWAVNQGYKIITIFLSIAHLDHDTTNNEPSNLKALCQQCHNRHDAKIRAINRRKKPPTNGLFP